ASVQPNHCGLGLGRPLRTLASLFRTSLSASLNGIRWPPLCYSKRASRSCSTIFSRPSFCTSQWTSNPFLKHLKHVPFNKVAEQRQIVAAPSAKKSLHAHK